MDSFPGPGLFGPIVTMAIQGVVVISICIIVGGFSSSTIWWMNGWTKPTLKMERISHDNNRKGRTSELTGAKIDIAWAAENCSTAAFTSERCPKQNGNQMPLPPFTLSRFSFDSSNQPLRHESVDVHDANPIDLYLYTLVRHQCGRFGVSFRISNKTKMTINSKKRRNVTNKSALVSISFLPWKRRWWGRRRLERSTTAAKVQSGSKGGRLRRRNRQEKTRRLQRFRSIYLFLCTKRDDADKILKTF